MKIRDYVSKRAPNIVGRLTRDFGLSLELLDKQIQGDSPSLKELGEASRQAQLVNHFLPQVVNQWKEIITAQRDYNQAIGELVKEGEKYGIAVTKAEAQAVLSESKYNHGISEIEAQSVAAQLLENSRYTHNMEMIAMKAELETSIQGVNNRAALTEQMNRPYLMQMDENSAYKRALGDHYLEFGESSRADLIVGKNYLTGAKGFLTSIGAKLGLLK